MLLLDLLGQPCPIPVIRTRQALEVPECREVRTLVDNLASVQNLEKMAQGLGYVLTYTREHAARFCVTISKTGEATPFPAPLIDPQPAAGGATVLITRDTMGSGNDELGAILLKGFIFSLTELPVRPQAVLFLNTGVRLAVAGSNTLEDLGTLADAGTAILVCGTCLNYFGLTGSLAVGEVTDMFTIATRLAGPGKLITL